MAEHEEQKGTADRQASGAEQQNGRPDATGSGEPGRAARVGILQQLLSFLPRLWTNWITLAGAGITTIAAGAIIVAVAVQITTAGLNPYAAMFSFLFMPAAFVFGLLLIPIGFFYEARRQPRAADPIMAAFRQAVQDRSSRRRILFLIGLTLLNLVIVGTAGNQALHFMDSVEFCGQLCHEVMEPEYNAYLRSPHSRVRCVECHIGEGATWMVKSKISGLRQVWAVLVGSFHRPIPSPVKELRPARDTCEQCHWPAKFHGNRVAFYTHYQEDEQNTPQVTALLLKVGGQDARGRYHGIHWHVSTDIEIRYQALDDKRERIGRVEVWRGGKLEKTFLPPGEQGGQQVREQRLMDCVDCHNRPTHAYDPSPALAVDEALASGRLDASLPYLRKLAVAALQQDDLDRDRAEEILFAKLTAAYQKDYPQLEPAADKLQAQAKQLAAIYRRNVYPGMKITWDTYPNHLGHRGEEQDKRGCFRCHDDEHATESGETLSQDCDLCHEMLVEEENPEDIPEELKGLLGSS